MYRHVYTMYIYICKFPFMYMTRTGIYINVQTCMYICLFVHTWYIHVHTMYVHVWHFLTCMYMLNTCLYRFSKSCPGGQDSRHQQTGHYLFYLWKFELTYVTYVTYNLLMIYLWTSIPCFRHSYLWFTYDLLILLMIYLWISSSLILLIIYL